MIRYYHLDTFSSKLLKGNPTPVCMMDSIEDSQHLAMLAKEFKAPVTAFITNNHESSVFQIRYFTPETEIPACGHATLGAAFVVAQEEPTLKNIEFVTVEKIRIKTTIENELVYLSYPVFTWKDYDIPHQLNEALGIDHSNTHFYCHELASLFIEMDSPEHVKQINPNFEKLRESSDEIKEVVIMSSSESEKYDVILRSFCPWIGIDEDPVTGSIHSVLGPYWTKRKGKGELVFNQASEKGGEIFVRALKNSVLIGGEVRIVDKGDIKSNLEIL